MMSTKPKSAIRDRLRKTTAVSWGEIPTCHKSVLNMASRPKQNKLSNKFTSNPSSRRTRNVDKGHLHALQCLERMEEFRTSEILCDVVLESCDGALFKVHRLVLAACSSYFQAMFTNEMRESKEEKVKIPLESHVLKLLIEYAYTCKMDLKSLTQVKAVLVAANMLLFNGAEKICVDYIGRKINTKNCVEVITVAEMISSQELSRIAFEFMEKNFVELSCQKGMGRSWRDMYKYSIWMRRL